MKKLIAAIALCIAVCTCLCACGSQPTPDPKAIDYDTGRLTASAPSGWLFVPEYNYSNGRDSDGNYPLDPTQMCFCKGGESEYDVLTKPCFYVYLYDMEYDDGIVEEAKEYYASTEDIVVKINNKNCKGFHATLASTEYDEPYEYDILFIPFNSSFVMIDLVSKRPDYNWTLSINDAEVLSILSSINLSKDY